VERATSQGVELNPRTLAYYVSIGLVAPPVRAPFSGADGRVHIIPSMRWDGCAAFSRSRSKDFRSRRFSRC